LGGFIIKNSMERKKEHHQENFVTQELFYDLEARFSRHLDIYAQNGKELKALTTVINEVVPLMKENSKQTKEMYDVFSGIHIANKWVKFVFRYILAIIVGVGSIFAALTAITHFFRDTIK